MKQYKKTILKITLLLMVLIGGIFSCANNDDINHSYSSAIIGEWKWIKTYKDLPLGDMNPLTPENTGITESIIFTKDSSWSKIKNQIEIESGEKFTIGHGFYQPTNQEYDSILYIKNGMQIGIDYFKIEENNLIFSSGFAGIVGSGSKWFERNK